MQSKSAPGMPSLGRLEQLLISVVSATQRMERYRFFIWTIQVGIFCLVGTIAFLLRFEFVIPPRELQRLFLAIPAWALIKALIFLACGLDRGWWNFVSFYDLPRLAGANVLSTALCASFIEFVMPGFPRSVHIIDFVVCLVATTGIRIMARTACELTEQTQSMRNRKAVFLYGAGTVGVRLLREIRSNPHLGYDVAGFLDDNPDFWGLKMHGTSVLGPASRLRELAKRRGVHEVFITIPPGSAAHMTGILERCHEADVRCRIIPSFSELISEADLARQIRDVAVEDLLGRPPVQLEVEQIRDRLSGQTVIVTGAGGSIGSELCRQIVRFRPKTIVGYDIAENALFTLDREMKSSFPDIRFVPEIGSIQNEKRVSAVLSQYRPSILYHAAAYKHVPLMERHAFEAVANNVFGTHTVARAAIKYGIGDFVMISSDKAVRPTSIMGATKRIAETVIYSLPSDVTKFVSVRFGNVLGSNGSAIPIFKEQIAAGGPVTVTHPDMKRYFMTIPEAVQLVLQASTMGRGHEIFVLEMGEPIRIVDLVRNLVLLSGLRPDKDIRIEFTGVRAGEKLYEELATIEEQTSSTTHDKIRVFFGTGLPLQELNGELHDLRQICSACDLRRLVLKIRDLVPEYNPSTFILRQILPQGFNVRPLGERALVIT
jgi:FlaA1/EpsC-like NDP-sugar epimerase